MAIILLSNWEIDRLNDAIAYDRSLAKAFDRPMNMSEFAFTAAEIATCHEIEIGTNFTPVMWLESDGRHYLSTEPFDNLGE